MGTLIIVVLVLILLVKFWDVLLSLGIFCGLVLMFVFIASIFTFLGIGIDNLISGLLIIIFVLLGLVVMLGVIKDKILNLFR